MAARRTLAECTVGLGVTGSIAAYKSAAIVRLLTKSGIRVPVIMTRAATRLISPDTLATLSGLPVATEIFPPRSGSSPEMAHLETGQSVDLMLVAPATANIIGKVAAGIADDLLSTAIMACNQPVLFAPAMNERMWTNPIVQRNVATLQERGYQFVGPEEGELACREAGTGRMVAPETAVDRALQILLSRLEGLRILITTGPTEEPVDAVRVLANRSSGKMGVRIAEAARDRGHRVTLVAGPLHCAAPLGVERIDVTTAAEMQRVLEETEAGAEILIMAAAVADYRPAHPEQGKIRSGAQQWDLRLTRNPDILARIAPPRAERGAVTIGFALEVGEGGEERAMQKLKSKGLDMIVLNDATRPDSAFGAETTQPAFLFADGRIEHLPLLSKADAGLAVIEGAEVLHGLKSNKAAKGVGTSAKTS
ncbi:MAG: bifunctional phosphopantothenoylcysteine decarboxylase/phosphopantothenate--cysteine ligase CoaBC [Candidatus Eisenbacteria sp.]|nr:bifunctional phosphopantothenoylcysteine decarboxylase/phosphopantothenate--cysteine ligase CoaBC [Candidatus Eisenbacteria bacterium]